MPEQPSGRRHAIDYLRRLALLAGAVNEDNEKQAALAANNLE